MVDQYYVVGHPISHSLSPTMQALFAQQTGESLRYGALDIMPGGFVKTLNRLKAQGVMGVNVTLPYKQEAHDYASELTNRAKQAGAVNTICFHKNGSVVGDNTDGVGFMVDLCHRHHQVLKEKRILVLGAGGAARGVLPVIFAEKPACVVIANRTIVKAEQLAGQFQALGQIKVVGYEQLSGQFDLIIHTTSVGLGSEVLPLKSSIFKGAFCYDLAYAKALTPILQMAKGHGASGVADGRGMLVEQGAEAFYLWRGIRPQTSDVLARLFPA